jgi:hypothetical protein
MFLKMFKHLNLGTLRLLAVTQFTFGFWGWEILADIRYSMLATHGQEKLSV